jgi:hypothetical protein
MPDLLTDGAQFVGLSARQGLENKRLYQPAAMCLGCWVGGGLSKPALPLSKKKLKTFNPHLQACQASLAYPAWACCQTSPFCQVGGAASGV